MPQTATRPPPGGAQPRTQASRDDSREERGPPVHGRRKPKPHSMTQTLQDATPSTHAPRCNCLRQETLGGPVSGWCAFLPAATSRSRPGGAPDISANQAEAAHKRLLQPQSGCRKEGRQLRPWTGLAQTRPPLPLGAGAAARAPPLPAEASGSQPSESTSGSSRQPPEVSRKHWPPSRPSGTGAQGSASRVQLDTHPQVAVDKAGRSGGAISGSPSFSSSSLEPCRKGVFIRDPHSVAHPALPSSPAWS